MSTVTKLIPLILLCLNALSQTHWTYTVDTIAGHYPLGDGGPATDALLGFPEAARLDGQGNLYIADTGNRRVRRVDPSGTITTAASMSPPTPVSGPSPRTASSLSSPAAAVGAPVATAARRSTPR